MPDNDRLIGEIHGIVQGMSGNMTNLRNDISDLRDDVRDILDGEAAVCMRHDKEIASIKRIGIGLLAVLLGGGGAAGVKSVLGMLP